MLWDEEDNYMDISLYKDAMCEAKTMDNDFLFYGKIIAVNEQPSLTFDLVSKSNEPLMILAYGARIKLAVRINKQSVFFGGRVYLSDDNLCRVTDIIVYQDFERRSFFRVKANANCHVKKETEEEDAQVELTADLIELSLGGIKFRSNAQFDVFEIIELYQLKLSETIPAFTLTCRILEVIEIQYDVFLYRCEFQNLDMRTSNQLSQCIFELQRAAIQRKKSRK